MQARQELLAEIDHTIDQLLANEEMQKQIYSDPQYEVETVALAKTQESLLAHLIHLQSYIEERDTILTSKKMDATIKKISSLPHIRHRKSKKNAYTNLKSTSKRKHKIAN